MIRRKAFTRFHGVTPSSVKLSEESLKYFYTPSINIYIRGGFNMERKIIPNIPEINYYGNEVDYTFSLDKTPYEDIVRLLKTFGWEAKCVKVLSDKQGKPLNTDNEQIENDFVDKCSKYGGFLWSQGIGWEGAGLENFRSKDGRKITT
jgi:hypothetical protein